MGAVCAVVYAKLILPTKATYAPKFPVTLYPIMSRGSVVLPITRRVAVHVHHWLIYASMLLCLDLPEFATGFMYTLTVQGLLYPDAFWYVVRNPYTLEIIS